MIPCGRRAEPSSFSHLPAHLLRCHELFKGRGPACIWNLHLPARGHASHSRHAHQGSKLSEYLAWVCRKFSHELLNVGLADAEASRKFSERASRLLAHEPLARKALDYARLLRTAPGARRSPVSFRFLKIPA
jgi:hypothetical protein